MELNRMIKEKNKGNNDKGILFFVIFIPWVILISLYTNTYFSDYISPGLVYDVLMVAPIILTGREIINNKYDKKIMMGYLCLSLFFIVCYRSIGNNGIAVFDVLYFSISARNIQFKKVGFTYLLIQSGVLIVTLYNYRIGKLPNAIFVQDGRYRNSLGYLYSTFSSQTFFYLAILYVYLRNKKITYVELAIIEIITIYFYRMTGTRNPFYLTTFLIVVIGILKVFRIDLLKITIYKKLVPLAVPVCGIFAILAAYMYNSSSLLFRELDRLFSNRLHLASNGLHNFGVKLFGQSVDMNGGGRWGALVKKDYNLIDSSYVQALVIRGVIFVIVIFLIYYILVRQIINMNSDRSEYLSLIIVVMAIHCTFDPQLLSLWYNPFILLIGYVFNTEFYMTKELIE